MWWKSLYRAFRSDGSKHSLGTARKKADRVTPQPPGSKSPPCLCKKRGDKDGHPRLGSNPPGQLLSDPWSRDNRVIAETMIFRAQRR